jgi:hypothetical protein
MCIDIHRHNAPVPGKSDSEQTVLVSVMEAITTALQKSLKER